MQFHDSFLACDCISDQRNGGVSEVIVKNCNRYLINLFVNSIMANKFTHYHELWRFNPSVKFHNIKKIEQVEYLLE